MTGQATMFNTMRRVLIAGSLIALASPLAGKAVAQQSEPGRVGEDAIAILQEMSDYLSGETTVSFRARTFFDVAQDSGIKIKMAREVEVILERPDRLYAETLDDAGAATSIWWDGSKLTVWRRGANEFMTLDVAGDTDALLDQLTDEHAFQIPLADLLYSDVSRALGETIISSDYVGLRAVDGVQCHHVSFESEGADWQIWIEADSTPVPRRFVIDYVTDENQPQFMAQLDAWSLGGEIEEFRFTAAMPEGVRQVEFGAAAASGNAPR